MYKVLMEGGEVIWNCHTNQLRIRAVILPTSNSTNSNTVQIWTAIQKHHAVPVPLPRTLRRSTRIRRPRKPWSSRES